MQRDSADISRIKSKNIDLSLINTYKATTVSGIEHGHIQSLGGIHIFRNENKNVIVSHYFQVVQNNFPIPCDGINKQSEIVLPPSSDVIRQIRFLNLQNDIHSCVKSRSFTRCFYFKHVNKIK